MKQVEAFGNAYRSSEKYPYITNCKNDPAITLFLNQVSKQNADALFIISEMRKTFNIYGLYEAKQYVLSEDVRIANIKQNFGNCYYKNIGGNPQSFKALIKIGNAHSQRGLSYFDRYDIGNTVAELAYLNGTSSTHIQCMRRYRKNEEGAVMDFYNDGYEVYPNIITQTDSTKWVVIDLRPLRQLLVNRKIKINSKEERDLIKQNDIVLLIPVDGPHKSSQNY
jgi:hypothetical protein